MPSRVKRYEWPLIGGALVAYLIAGIFYSHFGGSVQQWIIKIGILSAVIVPLLLVFVYTRTGSKWWQNDVGSGMVQCALSISYLSLPLAYTFWFDNGNLTLSFWGWMEISAPGLVSLALLRLSFIFYRKLRAQRDQTETPEMQEDD